MKKKPILKFKTIVLSDVHLGTADCKVEEVNHLLKHSWSEKLILNGDIIDGWSLSRRGGWKSEHTWFIRRVLKIAEKKNTDVIYLAGNHDEVLRHFLPVFFDKFRIAENYIHEGVKGNYLCLHGDVFDAVTRNARFISILGDIGYTNLLRLNRLYARYRKWRGLEYYSLSKAIKQKVKTAVNHLSAFEDHLQNIAEKQGCSGVICGHIHTPENKKIGDIHYLNSGDWVESLTALVEHFDGTWEVIEYKDFCERLTAQALQHRGQESLDTLTPAFGWAVDEPVEVAG